MPGIDILIHSGRLIDGTGNPWFHGDLAIRGERIAAILPPGSARPEDARQAIDATGLVVCPGFIDIQSHSIAPLMADGRSASKLTQGVTTEIMGEGWTPAPFGGRVAAPIGASVFAERLPEWVERARTWSRFGDWLEAMVERGVSPNIGSFLGGGTLRQYAMGMDMEKPKAEEMALMKRLVAESMEDGAFGVSFALIYPPDAYTDTEELVEISREIARHHGLYITHIRSEAEHIFAALDEAFEIARRAGLPVEIYHLKASGKRNWDKMPQVIEKIDEARREGLDVTADMYPYAASGTGLTSVLPPWAASGGRLFDNLRDPQMRARIKTACLEPDGTWEAMAHHHGADGVMPVGLHKSENAPYVGRRLSEIAAERNQDWFDAAVDLLLSEGQRISTIYFSMSEDNIRLQLPLPWVKISTDAGGYDPTWGPQYGPTHPRAYGTYPRVLGRYVREQKVLSLEEAVRKMSSAVAARLGLRQRGLLRSGMQADVVVFDPAKVADRSTFADSHQLSTGVRHVWVNGVRVVRDETHTGATPGQVVRGPG